MLFRRQDIPKTTRTPKNGGPRRIYPRFIRDRKILPKIDLAIDYLTSMVGHKRSELSQQTILELLGDPKLARCLLSCLGDTFHYVTPEFSDVVGDERAAALGEWSLTTPAELRAFIYRLANDQRGGFVDDVHRSAFLSEIAKPLGLEVATLDQLLHLDADRNAILHQRGSRPKSEDVVASYNARLALSVIRQASRVRLTLTSLDDESVTAICERHEIDCTRRDDGQLELRGRKDSHGSYARHGHRLARCVHHLILQASNVVHADATVYLNDRPLRFEIDDKVLPYLKPRQRWSADATGQRNAAKLIENLTEFRIDTGVGRNWTIRRLPESRVVDGALVLPEFSAVRDRFTVDFVLGNAQCLTETERAALRSIAQKHSLIVVNAELSGFQTVSGTDAEEIFKMLDNLYANQTSALELASLLRGLIKSRPFIPATELFTLVSAVARHHEALHNNDQVVFLPDLGLFERERLRELETMVDGGSVNISVLRDAVVANFGEAIADALTIRLLSNHRLLPVAA